MESLLRQFLDVHQVRSGRILVGVSGGADSVALLRGLLGIAGEFQLELTAAHYDHALRPDSADDARWVATLCRERDVRCFIERRKDDHSGNAGPEKEINIAEEISRKLRYEFFARSAKTFACHWVALAHTADDQAETVLHHILRGSGLNGLAGIPPIRQLNEDVCVIRPLLSATRRELLTFLESLGQGFRSDPTNLTSDYTRNRIRNELLPWLREKFNPRVSEALLRLSEQAADAQATLEFLAEKLLDDVLLERQKGIVRLQREPLADRPVGLLRELFSRLWQQQHWPRQGISFAHLDQLARMVQTGDPPRTTLPGNITAICRDPILELRQESAD